MTDAAIARIAARIAARQQDEAVTAAANKARHARRAAEMDLYKMVADDTDLCFALDSGERAMVNAAARREIRRLQLHDSLPIFDADDSRLAAIHDRYDIAVVVFSKTYPLR